MSFMWQTVGRKGATTLSWPCTDCLISCFKTRSWMEFLLKGLFCLNLILSNAFLNPRFEDSDSGLTCRYHFISWMRDPLSIIPKQSERVLFNANGVGRWTEATLFYGQWKCIPPNRVSLSWNKKTLCLDMNARQSQMLLTCTLLFAELGFHVSVLLLFQSKDLHSLATSVRASWYWAKLGKILFNIENLGPRSSDFCLLWSVSRAKDLPDYLPSISPSIWGNHNSMLIMKSQGPGRLFGDYVSICLAKQVRITHLNHNAYDLSKSS